MDVWKELLCFTIDAVLFGLSYCHYNFMYNAISGIKKAQKLGVNPDPKQLTPEEKKCAMVQGTVQSLVETLPSFYSPHTKGVIQKVTITEHAISKNSTGFWSDKRHVIQEMLNSVPFALRQGNYMVHILDSRSAYQIDLDVVATKFEPTNAGLFDGIMGFFSGIRQRGLETTEEMLKEGTVITGVGEIDNQAGAISLSPPSDGSAYFLTVMPVPSLLRKLEGEKTTYKWLSVVFGVFGVVIGGLLMKRCWFFYLRRIEENETRKRLEEARRLRRTANRTTSGGSQEDLPEGQRCVVCRSNPREIILLPCGHICLCEDCSVSITNSCPICRSAIKSKSAFFF